MKRQPAARKGTIVSTLHLRGPNLGASVFWALCVGLAAAMPLGAQTLHCGDVVHGTIASPGQIDSYSLDCVAGDVVRLTSISLNGVVGPGRSRPCQLHPRAFSGPRFEGAQ